MNTYTENKGIKQLLVALFFVFFIGLISCSPQNKLLKQARIQNHAGMHEEAANLYYNVLLTDAKNKEAKQGLLQNAQLVINDKFAKFSKQVIDGNIEDALKTYQFAQGYFKNADKVGVVLSWPNEYEEVHADILREYTDKQFDLAVSLMQNRKYETAEKVFERMATFDTSFKNVSVLRLHTVLDPLYNKALDAYQKGDYKDAYFLFNKIVGIDDGYKDALKLRNQAQQQATSVVGVLPIGGQTFNGLDFSDLSFEIADKLSQQQGAYVKIADVKALQREIDNRGFSGFKTMEQAIDAAKNLNLGYAVIVWFDSVSYTKSKPDIYIRDAYESVTENILNPYTNTYSSISRFKKATYTDKTEAQQLSTKVRVVLLQVKTQQILLSEVIGLNKNDELHAAIYKGNSANLYPNLPDGNYLPHVSQEWRNMFTNPRKNLIPLPVLSQSVVDELAEKMALLIQPKLR